MHGKSGWNRVSRRNPCPVCDGPDNCTVSDDGCVVWCGRISHGSVGQNNGGQFLHRLRDSHRQEPAAHYEHPPHRRKRESSQHEIERSGTVADWQHQTDLTLLHPRLDDKRRELADKLGVSVAALERLTVGWSDRYDCWTIPERDATGQIVGLSRRYPSGRKTQWPGGQRGLTCAPDWIDDPGPVYLVEGGSDTAALLSVGLCAIGRPSNSGGVDLLIGLLSDLPDDRDVFVIGENDQKPHESLKPSVRARHKSECEGCSNCWPGQFGAMSTARQLADALQRPVEVIFPPDGSKDVRDLIHQMNGAH